MTKSFPLLSFRRRPESSVETVSLDTGLSRYDILCVITAALFSASCAENLTAHSKVSRTGNAETLAPTRVGMTLENAYAAIAGSGQFVPDTSGAGYNLMYHYKIGNYTYVVMNGISADKKVSSLKMTLSEAYEMAESASECTDFFEMAVDDLSRKFGSPDFAPRFHNENGNIVSKAIFTFSDSTSIHAKYAYPQHGRGGHTCLITVEPVEQWQEFSPSFVPIVPMMRTPWSRYK